MKLKTIVFIAVLTAISLTSCKNSPATENSVAESSVEEQSIIAETTKPEESSTVSETSIKEISEDDFFHADTGQSTTSSQIIEDESSLIMEIAEYEYVDDKYSEGGIELTKYNGTDTTVTIPKQIDGMNVTSIGESAFEENENITSVTIPNTVTDIKDNAFARCTNLLNVTFEDNSQIDGIWDEVFSETAIQEFTVPENCRYVMSAFTFCNDITKVIILGKNTSLSKNFSIPFECTIYFPNGSEAEKEIKLHSSYNYKYLDELE